MATTDKTEILTERFLAAARPRLEETAYGHYELGDYGFKIDLAWRSEKEGQFEFDLTAQDSEGNGRHFIFQSAGSVAEALVPVGKRIRKAIA